MTAAGGRGEHDALGEWNGSGNGAYQWLIDVVMITTVLLQQAFKYVGWAASTNREWTV